MTRIYGPCIIEIIKYGKTRLAIKNEFENIKFSYENLNAKFRAIFITPKYKNNTDITREIIAGEIAPCTSHMFKFVDFNEQTGECIAVGYRDVYRIENSNHYQLGCNQ